MKGASRMNNKELAIYAGNKIKEFRKIKNWTQQQLATKLNTTKATISNYETGYRSPKKDMLFTIADVFNISIDDFSLHLQLNRTHLVTHQPIIPQKI